MTTETIPIETARRTASYPDAPPRDDMQKLLYLDNRSTIATLTKRFGNPDATLAVTRAPLGSSLSEPGDARIPDLMAAFNCDKAQAIKDNGYCVANRPHASQFALEIAPHAGGIVDFAEKRADYERYGVAKYWRFDPTGEGYHDEALTGDRLVGGSYEPVSIYWFAARRTRGYSRALGLYACWEWKRPLFYDPIEGRHLRSYSEHADERRQAEIHQLIRLAPLPEF